MSVQSCLATAFECCALFCPADPADPNKVTDETRTLGLVVCRGTQVTVISPVDGMEEIANPFMTAEG
jgi:hypothetical protein